VSNESTDFSTIKSCHTCGLTQHIPDAPKHCKAVCSRCESSFSQCKPYHNILCGIFSATALVLYLPAIILPLIKIERLGYMSENNLLSGVMNLLSEGYWFVGIVVLVFSIIIPPLKLFALLSMTTFIKHWHHHHRARLYRLVEIIGRWGMLDILLMAILVAFVKLGNLVEITAGSGLNAFTGMVILSLLASFFFHPTCLWEDDNVITQR